MNKLQAEQQLEQMLGVDVTVRQSGADVNIEWEDQSLKFSHLAEIAEMFGTEAIDIDNEFYSGCDTCDYGGVVTTTLTIRGVDLD